MAEIIEDMEITQNEFATRMGTTPKTVSMLIHGKCHLSNDLAQKLAAMLGSSVDVWLNLQKTYDEKIMEIQRQADLEAQYAVMQQIHYPYFVAVANLPATRNIKEKIANLCEYLKIADLRVLQKRDFLVNFRSGVTTIRDKNVINAQAWIQTAMNFAKNIQVGRSSAEKLRKNLPAIRAMTNQKPEVFLPELRRIFAECGVVFVLLPHLKNSGINDAVK